MQGVDAIYAVDSSAYIDELYIAASQYIDHILIILSSRKTKYDPTRTHVLN